VRGRRLAAVSPVLPSPPLLRSCKEAETSLHIVIVRMPGSKLFGRRTRDLMEIHATHDLQSGRCSAQRRSY
jgi:hypothetical protein